MPNQVIKGAEAQTESAFTVILEKIPLVIGALVVLAISIFLANIAKKMVTNSLIRRNADDNVILLAGKTTKIGVLVLGLTISLKIIGIDITTIVGLFSMGLAFAMKDIIQNFVSGALIILQEPFKIGDVIQVGTYLGKVISIESRATNIKTFDGQQVLIPNADVFSQSLTNFSAHPDRRGELIVGVDYSTNLAQAGQIVMDILTKHPSVLQRPPARVFFKEFGDSSINLVAKFWIDVKNSRLLAVKSNILQEVKLAFDKAKINIPFPVRNIKFDESFEQELFGKEELATEVATEAA